MRKAGIDAELTISYDGAKMARSILNSLDPDNKFKLRGLRVRGWVSGRKVIVDIHCERGMNSLINTLEDIFSCTGVAEEGLSSLKGLRGEVRGRERGRQGRGGPRA
jgi:hypothetical protein